MIQGCGNFLNAAVENKLEPLYDVPGFKLARFSAVNLAPPNSLVYSAVEPVLEADFRCLFSKLWSIFHYLLI
jgi:hypothetical protein